MVAVVQGLYPKYDKAMQSKCENGDDYGISLRPDAMRALYENGTDAVLIGEMLMRAKDRSEALRSLREAVAEGGSVPW